MAFLGEAGQTYSQHPQPVQSAGSTTTRLAMFTGSHAKSSAPQGQAPTHALHSRLSPSRQAFASTEAVPIGGVNFDAPVKRGIAPLGQTLPHRVQEGWQ